MSDLERLIDERARAILAEEKAEVARAEAAAARAEERRRKEARREELEAAAAKMARELALLRKYQGRGFPMPRSFLGWGIIAVLVALLGMVPHFILFPALHWTPASFVCPLVCEGCSPSMRIMTDCNSVGDTTYCGESTYLCRSSKVDVDAILVLSDGERSPNKLNAFFVELLESLFSVLILWPLYRRWDRRNELKDDARLVEELARTEAELKALGGAKLGAADPYR